MESIDARLASISTVNYGVIPRRRAHGVQVDNEALARRVASGALLQPCNDVFIDPGTPDTFERRATMLLEDGGPGTALGIQTALAWYQVAGFKLEPIHVMRPRGSARFSTDEVVWHRSRFLPPHHTRR